MSGTGRTEMLKKGGKGRVVVADVDVDAFVAEGYIVIEPTSLPITGGLKVPGTERATGSKPDTEKTKAAHAAAKKAAEKKAAETKALEKQAAAAKELAEKRAAEDKKAAEKKAADEKKAGAGKKSGRK